jgi:HSP20 family protein
MYPIAHLINTALEGAPFYGRTMAETEHLVPRTNILEGEQDFRIVMDLPGVRNEDLDISLEGKLLTVKADRDLSIPEGYTGRRTELASKLTWKRSFDLGDGVDVEKIGARLENGILTLTLAKSDKVMPRRIQVQ